MSCLNAYKIFLPIFQCEELIISFGLHPFDICYDNPTLWFYIKISFIFFYITSNIILLNSIISLFSVFQAAYENSENTISPLNNNQFNLLIGKDESTNSNVFIPESGLYQNFLITGTIGTGKTSSAMYPFTEQLMQYNSLNPNNKIAILILDVKGNYFNHIKHLASKYNLNNDIIEISLNSGIRYNPLHKPFLSPMVLANRLKTILLLFSENNSESFWLDKVEQVLAESIKLCRLYNNGYVTFTEIHKLITEPDYYTSKIQVLKKLFLNSKYSYEQIYELNTALNFFEKEFNNLDSRTLSILKSEITRITNLFVSDYSISKTFCAPKSELNFKGFHSMLSKGKIVVLNMNIAEYQNLSKTIAAYLKLDFQSEVMYNLSHNKVRTSAFICDEYSEYVTKTDANFFSLSREAKCINIVCTQSYSSLKNTLKEDSSVKVIIQNLINKIWYRTDDIYTIEEAQKQLGKEDKQKTSTSISENAKETRFNYITHSLNSKGSNITESYNTYYQNDYIFDTNFFTRNLETFSSLAFLSDGSKILKPIKLKMFPYFK
ncbi:MAG: TraM recognition domain-containing protein [Clostridia bacterium]|nr:TraM recognition domain-containing protein [Clostridia bacterium]